MLRGPFVSLIILWKGSKSFLPVHLIRCPLIFVAVLPAQAAEIVVASKQDVSPVSVPLLVGSELTNRLTGEGFPQQLYKMRTESCDLNCIDFHLSIVRRRLC